MQLGAAATLVFLLTGCAPIRVNSFMERGVDFAQFQTYDWGPASALPTGDPRLDNNPFFHDSFQGAVEKRLIASGLRQAGSAAPDLLIQYHASMSQSFSVSGADRDYGDCGTGDCEARVTQYEAGTLVLDVRDARTNRVVWRSSAQQSVDGLIDNQDWMEKYVEKAVARMLEQFPRAGVPQERPVVGNR